MNDKESSIDWLSKPFSVGRSGILENIRILVYRENPVFFELLDYDNDKIFNEPLLFAFFIQKKKERPLSNYYWAMSKTPNGRMLLKQ